MRDQQGRFHFSSLAEKRLRAPLLYRLFIGSLAQYPWVSWAGASPYPTPFLRQAWVHMLQALWPFVHLMCAKWNIITHFVTVHVTLTAQWVGFKKTASGCPQGKISFLWGFVLPLLQGPKLQDSCHHSKNKQSHSLAFIIIYKWGEKRVNKKQTGKGKRMDPGSL